MNSCYEWLYVFGFRHTAINYYIHISYIYTGSQSRIEGVNGFIDAGKKIWIDVRSIGVTGTEIYVVFFPQFLKTLKSV